MPLQPPNNPLESLSVWLKDFNETVYKIIRSTTIKGVHLEPYVTNPAIHPFPLGVPVGAAKASATGIYTDGEYWLGFYYKVSDGNRAAHPWFGCEFVDRFNISIMVDRNTSLKGVTNISLHQYLLLNEFRKKPLWVTQANSNENLILKCCFSDYMKIGYPGIRTGNVNFNLNDWMCSSTTQQEDLKEFFKVINENYLAPHI